MAAIDVLRLHAAELAAALSADAEVLEEGDRLFVLLSKVSLPQGRFAVAASDVLFIGDKQYPLSSMDMFWVEREVVQPDGSVPQNADSIEQYLGRAWRRFSWHRNGVWRVDGNPLLDHFAFFEARLADVR
ncbi:MAG: hypothetical protein EPO26_12665 [Chloroflexota bacterium]|nr:MAG: hypothetical protein EPO26_12665 [Chloroflexota bacterium]